MKYAIFVPEEPLADPTLLADVGLGDHVGGAHAFAWNGLNGKRGVCFGWSPECSGCLGVEGLTWLPALATASLKAGRYFVGIDPTQPVQPHQLAKHRKDGALLAGADVILGDGNAWRIPAAAKLPVSWAFDDSSPRTNETIAPEFAGAFANAKHWFIELLKTDLGNGLTATITSDVTGFLTEFLRLNYRIAPEVVTHLGLWNRSSTGTSLLKIVDGMQLDADVIAGYLAKS